jgi:SAM-dependent methyltransferase
MICPVCAADAAEKYSWLGQGAVYRCSACGVHFLYPQLTDAELRELYGETYYRSWGITGRAENAAVKRMKTDTFDLRLDLISGYKSSGNILDVGCATGYFLEAARRRGFEAYGVEISSYSCAIAKDAIGAERVYEGTLEDCPFPEKHFDVIAMSDLLEHVRDPRKTLLAARRLLKDDGVIMVVAPDTDSLTRRLMGGKWSHYKAEHFFYFNRRSLEYLARQAGFAMAHFGPAKKAMNLEYLNTQFTAYPHWLFSPIAGCLHRLLPRALCAKNFQLTMGELAAILKNK